MPIQNTLQDLPKIFDIDGARQAGVPEDQILGALKGRFGNLYDYDGAIKAGLSPQQINDTVSRKLNNTVNPSIGADRPSWDQFKQGLSDARDRIIDLVKPIADAGATIVGGVAAGPESAGIASIPAGFAAGTATDALLQKLQSQTAQNKNRTFTAGVLGTQPGSTGETLANAVQNEGVNELLGKVGKAIISKGSALLAPKSELEQLGPTFSQYSGKPSSLSSMIENIWGANDKAKALQASSQAAREKFAGILAENGGQQSVNPADRFNIGKLNQQMQASRSDAESIGRMNTVAVPQPSTPDGKFGFQWQPAKNVEGPINIQNTAKTAQDFLTNLKRTYGDKPLSDVDTKLAKTAQGILDVSQNGRNPVPFRDAFDFLHGPNGDGGLENMSRLSPGEVNESKSVQGDLADSLHKDITNGIQNWGGQNSSQALDSYNTARSAALTKQVLSEGGNVQSLVNSTTSPIPAIDKALQDPTQTQKLLNTSNLAGLKSNNMAQDLRGYRLQQIWNKADNGSGLVDGNKLIQEWNNPAFAATKDQLFSKTTQDQMNQFFQNVKQVSQTGAGGSYGNIRMGMRGLEVGGGFLSGLLSGNVVHGLESAAGLASFEIPPYALAKLFTNPARAMVLNRLVTGQPLEMSTQQAGRLIMGGLNGIGVSLIGGDGKRQDVTIRDGKVQ